MANEEVLSTWILFLRLGLCFGSGNGDGIIIIVLVIIEIRKNRKAIVRGDKD
jgi:hypothetical protein